MLTGVSSTMRINFCTDGAGCGVADIHLLQSQGKTSCDFGNRTERVGISKIADVRGERIDFGRRKNPAEHGPSVEKKMGGLAVVSFEEFFELRKWLDNRGGVGGWIGSAGGRSVGGESCANGSDGQIERAGEGFECCADGRIGVDGGFGCGSNFRESFGAEIG